MLKSPLMLILFLLGMFFSACNKDIVFADSSQIATSSSNTEINNWIYKTMKEYYLWSDSMPVKEASNLSILPMDYFYTILHKYKTVDRFSWIEANSTDLINKLNGINTILGIKVNVFNSGAIASGKYVFVVACVIKNSPADTAGIVRGDIWGACRWFP